MAKKIVKRVQPTKQKAQSVKKAPPPKKPVSVRKPAPAKSAPKTVVRKKTAATTESQLRTIDKDLVQLLNKRMELTVEQLTDLKDRHSIWFDPNGDQELWERIEAESGGTIPNQTLRSIFREVLSASRSRVKVVRAAYLGPPFSFSHLAAIEHFGKSADLVPVNTIASVFEEVNRGHADYGVVPIENSTDGRIVDTLDMFTRLPLRICGEVQLAVHHNLLSRSARSEITEILDHYRDANVENIMALGGDVPNDLADVRPSDYTYANELVDHVHAYDFFSVGVAAHPEGHPRSPDRATDRRRLADKLRYADFAITQFFFDADHYVQLVNELSALGVDKPVLPGIMPVTNKGQIVRMARMSGTALPDWLLDRLATTDDPHEVRKIGVDVATDLCQTLLQAGAPGLHFYTLNRSTATREIYANLNLSAAR